MPIIVTPESGIPLPQDTTPQELHDFRERARAYFNTVELLATKGLDTSVEDSDTNAAHQAFSTKTMPRTVSAGTVIKLEALLTEYDQELLDVHRRLRNYVLNKLLVETDNEDPKVRLKALELLGKSSGVGMFSDKVDVTVTHRSMQDIETELRKTIELYSGDYKEVAIEVQDPADMQSIDLDKELGG